MVTEWKVQLVRTHGVFEQRKLSPHHLTNRTSLLITLIPHSPILAFDQRNHTELHEGMALATPHSFHINQELQVEHTFFIDAQGDLRRCSHGTLCRFDQGKRVAGAGLAVASVGL